MPGWNDWFEDKSYAPDIPFAPKAGDWRAPDATLGPRPSFHPRVRAALEAKTETRVLKDPDGKDFLQYKCQACRGFGAGADMHMGHSTNWSDYISPKGPLCDGAIEAAYNDLNNLRFEHIACNVSHIFESTEDVDLTGFAAGGWDSLDATAQGVLIERLSTKAWFDGKTPDEIRAMAPSALDIFEKLRARHEAVDDVAAGEMIVDTGGGESRIVLAEPIVAHRGTGLVEIAKMKRPAWDKSTRAGLYTMWKASGLVKKVADETYYRCASCGNWGEGHAMHIGHIENWRTYVASTVGQPDGICIKSHAEWAYNDLRNLQFEHATCNMGHEWEEHCASEIPAEVAATIREENVVSLSMIDGRLSDVDLVADTKNMARAIFGEIALKHGIAPKGTVPVFDPIEVPFGLSTITVDGAQLLAAYDVFKANLAGTDDVAPGPLMFGGMTIPADIVSGTAREAVEPDIEVTEYEEVLEEEEEADEDYEMLDGIAGAAKPNLAKRFLEDYVARQPLRKRRKR